MAAFLARENLALILSSIGAALFAVLGITWGLWVDSLVILFDGAYSLVSLMLSLLSVYAARLMRKPACDAFPLGRADWFFGGRFVGNRCLGSSGQVRRPADDGADFRLFSGSSGENDRGSCA